MNKKAMRKDFYMEIRRSLGRFLSIFFIVALGVAFFSGIRSAQPDMLLTGDSYFDGSNLMDLKVVSTFGLTEDDIEAIRNVKGVERAEGGYSLDVLSKGEDNQEVLHLMSVIPEMNTAAVTKGRMPVKAGECLADNESDYQVGDVIKLESGTDTDITDSLKTDTLKVVGTGSSPCYISFSRGSSTIGTGNVSAFLMVPEETFDTEVYTEAYAFVNGTKDLTAYSDAYKDSVEEVLNRIEDIADVRGEIRKEEILSDAQEKLVEAKQELADGKKEADEKLSEAEQTIRDGEEQLADAKAQLADGEKALADAKGTLYSKQKELDDAKNQYYAGAKQLADGKSAYEQGLKEYEQKKAEYGPVLEEGQALINQARQELDVKWEQYHGMEAQYGEMQTQYEALTAQLEGLDPESPDYEMQKAQIEASMEYLKPQMDSIAYGMSQMKPQLDKAEEELAAKSEELKQYQSALTEGEKTLESSKSQLMASQAQLDNAWSKIQSGQSQINQGWSEIASQEKKLEDAKAEIAQKEPELEDGRREYEEAKEEAEEEIADGEEKIKDAEEEIQKVEDPKWYVFDRTTLPEYSGYGENADRMKAIGQVFPVLFFLVAALISLTSMTRMVEEQRTQIGTMKALGYGKFAIASKYLGYAFLATVGGSIFGVLIGEKVIPYIIIYAYGIMYHHMNDILVPYNLYYAGMATAAAVVCTMAATMFSCYKELAAQPAVLMRPPAPKKGKRVFMERITFIWKHLSFIWKSTIRNLFRYKKRFFMTVFGIGGCMALILVGFGLRDSIFEIAQIQYKDIQVYDGMAYFEEDASKSEEKELKTFLDEEKEVEAYIDMSMTNVTLVNGSKEREAYECVPKNAKEINDFVKFHDRITKEKYQLDERGVILSEKTAKMLDAKAGDTIEIKDTEKGNKKVKIAEICENYMGHYMYMSPKLYEDVYGEQPEYNCLYFKMASDERDVLRKTGEEILSKDAVLNVTYLSDVEKQLNDMLKSLNLVIVVLIVSAGMLAFVVLYNLNNINITERKRELATIKVLGFYDPEVSAYVYRENIILTFVGALAGIVMGIILHRFIIQTVEVDAAMFGRIINFPSYIYSILFTFGFSFFVNWVMYFKLKKIDMVESLKSVE